MGNQIIGLNISTEEPIRSRKPKCRGEMIHKNIVEPNEIGRPNHHSKSCWGRGERGYSLQRMICESQNITKSDFRRPLQRYRLHFEEWFVHPISLLAVSCCPRNPTYSTPTWPRTRASWPDASRLVCRRFRWRLPLPPPGRFRPVPSLRSFLPPRAGGKKAKATVGRRFMAITTTSSPVPWSCLVRTGGLTVSSGEKRTSATTDGWRTLCKDGKRMWLCFL